jgi:hypothetical protein
MKRLIITMALAIAAIAAISAQTAATPDTPKETNPDKPKTETSYEPIRKGDQFIHVSLGAAIPLFYIGPNGINTDTRMNIGGTGGLGFSRFITSKVALGGSIAFAFNTTIGENLYFYLPVTFTCTYELVFDRIHVPFSIDAGVAFQTYSSWNYFGPILKPSIAVYYQYSPEWSFGVLTVYNCIPQLYAESSDNRTGNILDINAGFRYHF